MKIKIALLIFLCLNASLVLSQPYVDVINFKYQYFPPVNYSDTETNKQSSTQWEAVLLLPLVQKNKDVLLLGADYYKFDFDVTSGNVSNASLTSAALFFGYNRQWKKENWKTLFMFIPKVNAELENISSDDYQWGGVLLFDYKRREGLRYHFGAYYNREYFGNFLIPLLGIEWKINNTLNLFGDLPSSMNLEKKFSSNFYAGISFASGLASYRPEKLSGDDEYVREGDKSIGNNQLKIFLNYYFAKHIVVFAEAGHSLGKYFQLYDGDDMVNLPGNTYRKTKDGFLLNAGIAYRVRLD